MKSLAFQFHLITCWLLVGSSLTWGQSTCAWYNFSRTNTTIQQDVTQHAWINGAFSGAHTLFNQAGYSCNYDDPGNGKCDVLSQTTSAPQALENGYLTVIGYHIGFVNEKNGSVAANNGNGATSFSTGAASFMNCQQPGCNYSININGSGSTGWGVTFPQGQVWGDAQESSTACAGVSVLPPGSGCKPSPVVVDTTGKGFHFTNPKTECIPFDLAGKGKLQCYSWPKVGSGNAWLAYVPDTGSGVQNGKDNLFSQYTYQEDVKAIPKNGLAALQEWDLPKFGGNLNGMIDENDAVWPNLWLWIDEHCYKDRSVACTSLPGELHRPEEFGIYNLGFVFSGINEVDAYGNIFRFQVFVNLRTDVNNVQTSGDKKKRRMDDVWISRGPLNGVEPEENCQ